MQVLVTVGTTKFPELVTAAMDPEVATLLLSMGYKHMEVQVCGTGNQYKTHISGNHVHAFHTIWPSYLLANMQPYKS